MLRKAFIVFSALVFMGILISSCKAVPEYEEKEIFVPIMQDADYPDVRDDNGGFYDEFENGVDPDLWLIGKMQWGGTAANGGVIPENVAYTDDGILILNGNGDYYEGPIRGLDSNGIKKSNGKRTGSAIISKDILGPGSYEVKMKVLPRFGACSAMWTYFSDGSKNHEIDIEIPGNMKTFKYTLFSNWLATNSGSSVPVVPESPNNDGLWHTYRFDWHTDPKRVDYFIDGQIVTTDSTKVPTAKGRLWLGVWFPRDWNGNPNFDTGSLLVDYVKFTPFNEAGFEESIIGEPGHASTSEYPKQTSSLPETNYISNGDFEVTSSAWVLSGKTKMFDDPGRIGSKIAVLYNEDSSMVQSITAINKNMDYTLSAYGFTRQRGDQGIITIECTDAFNLPIEGTAKNLLFEELAFKMHTITFTTTQYTTGVRITLGKSGNKSEAYFDDLKLAINIKK